MPAGRTNEGPSARLRPARRASEGPSAGPPARSARLIPARRASEGPPARSAGPRSVRRANDGPASRIRPGCVPVGLTGPTDPRSRVGLVSSPPARACATHSLSALRPPWAESRSSVQQVDTSADTRRATSRARRGQTRLYAVNREVLVFSGCNSHRASGCARPVDRIRSTGGSAPMRKGHSFPSGRLDQGRSPAAFGHAGRPGATEATTSLLGERRKK